MARHVRWLAFALAMLTVSACAPQRAAPLFAPGEAQPGPGSTVAFGRIDLTFEGGPVSDRILELHLAPEAGAGAETPEILRVRSGAPFYVVLPAGTYEITGVERPAMRCEGVTLRIPGDTAAVYVGTLAIDYRPYLFAVDKVAVSVRDDFEADLARFHARAPDFPGSVGKSLIALPPSEGSARGPCESTAGAAVFPVSVFFAF